MKLTEEMLKDLGFYEYENNITKKWILESKFIGTHDLELRENDKNFPKTLEELGNIIDEFHMRAYMNEGKIRAKREIGKTFKEIIDYSNYDE